MSRYVSPVNPAVYPHLALTLLSIGLFFTAWFFVYPFKLIIVGTIKQGATVLAEDPFYYIKILLSGLLDSIRA